MEQTTSALRFNASKLVMSKSVESPADLTIEEVVLKSYRIPSRGQFVFACSKCEKKIRHGKPFKLKKALKREAKKAAEPLRLRVIGLPCLKLCPKNAIAVCTQVQLGTSRCSIVRTTADVAALYAQCVSGEAKRT
jgi:hypothetical protein